MVTQFLSAVSVSILKKPTASLVLHDADITGALDLLTTGV